MKSRAFTLIELLVAIGIVSLLAAILIPVTRKATEAAKIRVSANNLRQVGAATLMYASDHDQLLPPYTNWENFLLWYDPTVTTKFIPTDSDCPRLLIESLLPYTGNNREIFFAPLDRYRGTDYPFAYLNHNYSSYMFFPLEKRSEVATEPFVYEWPPVVSVLNLNYEVLWQEIGGMETPMRTYSSNCTVLAVLSDLSISKTHLDCE